MENYIFFHDKFCGTWVLEKLHLKCGQKGKKEVKDPRCAQGKRGGGGGGGMLQGSTFTFYQSLQRAKYVL